METGDELSQLSYRNYLQFLIESCPVYFLANIFRIDKTRNGILIAKLTLHSPI